MNIVENVRNMIAASVEGAVRAAFGERDVQFLIEKPKDEKNGEFSCNAAMVLAKELKAPPRKIAEDIVANLAEAAAAQERGLIEKVEVAGAGFINFYLKNDWLYEVLSAIEKEGQAYGKVDIGRGKRVMVEFVSANPTGAMHMGNARGGALGDCMASVLEHAGYDVTREFYINDAGNQIGNFGLSLEARYIQHFRGVDSVEFPEDGYHGEDITRHAEAFAGIHGDTFLDAPEDERREALISYALEKNIENLKADLHKYRIDYDVWFRESTLHESGEVNKTIAILGEKGYTYEKDGAVWLNCVKMGLEKDEVLVRQNGVPTYFAADIAYHCNKLVTRGFDMAIDIWGTDHHGHVARMKSALAAMGVEPDRLTVPLYQLVRLMQDGEVVRMSKRTGKLITLTDLLEDISVDAARFFFNLRGAGTHLDFDLGLAKRQSNDNPVYYVQYAHARICSIIRGLAEGGIEVPMYDSIDASALTAKEELDILRKLAELPEEVAVAANTLEPSRLTRYTMEISALFHSFYNACRVRGAEESVLMARLKLIDSVRVVLRSVLELLKITAPEAM